MKTKNVSYETLNFSQVIVDYLNKNNNLKDFVYDFFSIPAFEQKIEERKKLSVNRTVLYQVVKEQYATIKKSKKLENNIEFLKLENTFTVTTGHQLCLFSGPLYFIYKAITTIKLAQELSRKYTSYNIIPIFWLASEDHDFEEISQVTIFNKNIKWETSQKGAVGRMTLQELSNLIEEIKNILGDSENSKYLIDLIEECYTKNTLTEATRAFLNKLFAEEGLIVLDADNNQLKAQCKKIFISEILDSIGYKEVENQSKKLVDLGYKKQVAPREINLFYLKGDIRERIVKENNKYKVNNTSIVFSKEEILNEIEKNPENISPNVIYRPVYQELILPNLAYVGGGGELAYWFQLKSLFEKQNVSFPLLVLRNSVIWISHTVLKKIKKLNLSIDDLFLDENTLINKLVVSKSENSLDLSKEQEELKILFAQIEEKARGIDPSLSGSVKAEETKNIKSLKNLAQKLFKAEKRKQEQTLKHLQSVLQSVFPNGNLQERTHNFLEYQFKNPNFLKLLKETLNPLNSSATVILEE